MLVVRGAKKERGGSGKAPTRKKRHCAGVRRNVGATRERAREGCISRVKTISWTAGAQPPGGRRAPARA